MSGTPARNAAGTAVTPLRPRGPRTGGAPSPAVPMLRECLDELQPKVALLLGSRFADLADEVESAAAYPYDRLEGWPRQTLDGHRGRLVCGRLGGIPVVVLQGRAHYHDRGDPRAMRRPLSDLAEMGIETLGIAGSCTALSEDLAPGTILLVRDHINWSGPDPLVGEEGDARFVDLRDAYDPALLDAMGSSAAERHIEARTGVYAWFSGPSDPTPAEARAARLLGADAAATATAPEAILARRFGLRVAALLAVTAPTGQAPAEGGDSPVLQARPAHALLRDLARAATTKE